MRYANRQKMVASNLVVPWVRAARFIMLLKPPHFTIQKMPSAMTGSSDCSWRHV
jgi:hypothetical protein